jgi:hypothetical protein
MTIISEIIKNIDPNFYPTGEDIKMTAERISAAVERRGKSTPTDINLCFCNEGSFFVEILTQACTIAGIVEKEREERELLHAKSENEDLKQKQRFISKDDQLSMVVCLQNILRISTIIEFLLFEDHETNTDIANVLTPTITSMTSQAEKWCQTFKTLIKNGIKKAQMIESVPASEDRIRQIESLTACRPVSNHRTTKPANNLIL